MGGITPDDGHQLVNGRYRLVEVIGQGGMGTVWRGHDEMLDREVAIKEVTLSPDLDDDERAELTALALQEARATARLNHPGIITIYDVIDDDGVPVIVMELLHGRSLADILKEEVRLPYRRVAEIGTAALEALREAHAAGVVHRDLKPANILISDRRVVITDFGVAQRVGEFADEPGDVTGTPAFMAPEQAENAAASPSADLWALGATLFNATEGRPPYEGPDYATVLLTLLTQDPPTPVRAGPLAPLITALLRRDPERRPSAEQVAEQFAEVLSEKPGDTTDTATTRRPAIAPAVTEKPATPSPPNATGPARPSEAGPVRKAERPHPKPSPGPRIPPPGSPVRTGPQYGPPPTVKTRRVAAITALIIVAFTVLYVGTHADPGGSPASVPSALPSGPGDLPSDLPQPVPSQPPDDAPPEENFTVTALSPDGGLAAFGGDSGVVRLYDTATHKLRRSWKTSPHGGVGALAFSPDGRTIAASSDDGVDIWNVATRKKHRFSQLNDVIGALAFSSDGRTLTAVGGGGHVGVWTISTGRYASSAIPLGSDTTICNSMAVSPNGHDVACGYYDGDNGGMLVWDAKKNKRRASWPGAETAGGVAFSPDGKTLAFSGTEGNSLELWSIASHRMTAEGDAEPMLSGLAFSPDGRTLAVPASDSGTGEDTIEIWKMPGGKKATTIQDVDTPKTMALSHDGAILVTGDGSGGTLWKVRSHKQVASWPK